MVSLPGRTLRETDWALTYDLIVTLDTAVSTSRGPRYVSLHEVICLHEQEPDSSQDVIKCETVEFEFSNRSGKPLKTLLFKSKF